MKPTYEQVETWCEEHDGRPTEGWLALLLDGSIPLHEFKSAVSEGRAPRTLDELAVAHTKLREEVLDLDACPDYRGWGSRYDDENRLFLWRHQEYDEYITVDDLGSTVTIGGNGTIGYCVAFPERSAAALLAIVKPLLDEIGVDDDDREECASCKKPFTTAEDGDNWGDYAPDDADPSRCWSCAQSAKRIKV
jgi:hypothetical protein